MSNYYKLNKSPAVKLDRLRQYLTVPSFAVRCGHLKYSYKLDKDVYFIVDNGNNINFPYPEFSIDFWVKPYQVSGDWYLFSRMPATISLIVRGTDGSCLFSIPSLGVSLSIGISYDEWNFVSISGDSSGNFTLYVNESYISTTVTPFQISNAPLTFATDPGSHNRGKIGMIRMWKRARSYDDTVTYKDKFVGNDPTFQPDLMCNWLFDDIVTPGTYFADRMSIYDLYVKSAFGGVIDFDVLKDSEDQYEYKYGSSWAAGVFDVSIGRKCSIKFPITSPENTYGALLVAYTDDNDAYVRRSLWEQDGVDFNTELITPYRGEILPATFKIELWNRDGDVYAVLPSDLKLKLSLTTAPTTSVDITETEFSRLSAIDDHISCSFDASFPLTFTNPQWETEIVQGFLMTESGAAYIVTESGLRIRI